MGAMRANFQILLQLFVENHFFALGAFGPQPLGDVALASCAGAHRVFFDRRLLLHGGRSYCRFNRFARDDLSIWSWELRCVDCGYRETIAYRTDEEQSSDADPEICPFCQLEGMQSGRDPCT